MATLQPKRIKWQLLKCSPLLSKGSGRNRLKKTLDPDLSERDEDGMIDFELPSNKAEEWLRQEGYNGPSVNRILWEREIYGFRHELLA